MLALIAYFDLETAQFDAVNAFLNSPMPTKVFTSLPPGFGSQSHLCWLLQKALYGLCISPLLWFEELSRSFKGLGFTPAPDDPCIFIHEVHLIIIFFYVDDIVITFDKKYQQEFRTLRIQLASIYELRELGELHQFLNIRITRDRQTRRLWLDQTLYINKLLSRYKASALCITKQPLPLIPLQPHQMNATSDEIKLYQERIGAVLYLAVVSRPDIAYACSILAEQLQNPSPDHFKAFNHLLGYLRGTSNLAIEYSGEEEYARNPSYESLSLDSWMKQALRTSSDAAYGDCTTTRRSTQGMLITLFGGPIAWRSSKQKTVTTSTTEAELLALLTTAKELLWLE
jgi:reverse transcriptase-like protein